MKRSKRKEANSRWRLADSQNLSAPPQSSDRPNPLTGSQEAVDHREEREDQNGNDKNIEIAAVRLLARREHSTRELKRKLQGRGHSEETVERVVNKLGEKKLVSDERFATSFVAHHGRRGHGPIRIRAELRQQGATNEAIESALAHSELDWGKIAAAVLARKFGSKTPSSLTERAKQARFLQYRGFSTDQIRAAMASVAEDSAESALSDTDFDLGSDLD